MKNYLKVEGTVTKTTNDTEVIWRDVREEPFEIYGFCKSDDDLFFRRVPDSVAAATSPGVQKLAKEPTGGRVRFSTNSPHIAIRVKYRNVLRTHNLALISSAGFDIFVDTEYGSRYLRTFCMPADMTEDGYEQVTMLGDVGMRSYTVTFPIHSVVESVEIGLNPGALLGKTDCPYRNVLPVVFYGSSIVHGIAASRSGNAYPGMISRMLNVDFKNLGFSGAARGEEAIANWIAEQPMSIFVLDYDHNAKTPEDLEATHHNFYEIVRRKNPNLPIIMITRPDYGSTIGAQNATIARRDIIMRSYLKARENGDKNVYFIDGLAFYAAPHMYEMSVDSCHPNDAGFIKMADSIGTVIKHILEKQAEEKNKNT